MVFYVNEMLFVYFLFVFVFVVGVGVGCCVVVVVGLLDGLWLGSDYGVGVDFVVVDVVDFVLCYCVGMFIDVCFGWYYQQLL